MSSSASIKMIVRVCGASPYRLVLLTSGLVDIMSSSASINMMVRVCGANPYGVLPLTASLEDIMSSRPRLHTSTQRGI